MLLLMTYVLLFWNPTASCSVCLVRSDLRPVCSLHTHNHSLNSSFSVVAYAIHILLMMQRSPRSL